jgi:hypothetical protein
MEEEAPAVAEEDVKTQTAKGAHQQQKKQPSSSDQEALQRTIAKGAQYTRQLFASFLQMVPLAFSTNVRWDYDPQTGSFDWWWTWREDAELLKADLSAHPIPDKATIAYQCIVSWLLADFAFYFAHRWLHRGGAGVLPCISATTSGPIGAVVVCGRRQCRWHGASVVHFLRGGGTDTSKHDVDILRPDGLAQLLGVVLANARGAEEQAPEHAPVTIHLLFAEQVAQIARRLQRGEASRRRRGHSAGSC